MVEERILIVDDNVEMLDKTSALLSHVGYSVVTCTSGEEALERLEHELLFERDEFAGQRFQQLQKE